MNALDIQEITSIVPVGIGESESGADERGWWPVVAFTDNVRPIVLELNVN